MVSASTATFLLLAVLIQGTSSQTLFDMLFGNLNNQAPAANNARMKNNMALLDPFQGGAGRFGMRRPNRRGRVRPTKPDPFARQAQITTAEEHMSEVLTETANTNPERQKMESVIKQNKGTFKGDLAALNYIVQDFWMSTPGPVPPPNEPAMTGPGPVSPAGYPKQQQAPFQGQGPAPFQGQGPSPFQGPGPAPFQGPGLAPYQGNPMAPYQGNPAAPYQGNPAAPYQGPGSAPYQGPGSAPYQGPGSAPYQGPGSAPYQGPGSAPYQGPGSAPYQGPGSAPYQGNPAAPYQGNPAAPNPVPYQGNPAAQYQGNPATQYQGNPAAPYQGNPATQYQGNPAAPYQGNPAGQYQGNPAAPNPVPYQGKPAPYQGNPAAPNQGLSPASPQAGYKGPPTKTRKANGRTSRTKTGKPNRQQEILNRIQSLRGQMDRLRAQTVNGKNPKLLGVQNQLNGLVKIQKKAPVAKVNPHSVAVITRPPPKAPVNPVAPGYNTFGLTNPAMPIRPKAPKVGRRKAAPKAAPQYISPAQAQKIPKGQAPAGVAATTKAPVLGDVRYMNGHSYVLTDADGFDTFQWVKQAPGQTQSKTQAQEGQAAA